MLAANLRSHAVMTLIRFRARGSGRQRQESATGAIMLTSLLTAAVGSATCSMSHLTASCGLCLHCSRPCTCEHTTPQNQVQAQANCMLHSAPASRVEGQRAGTPPAGLRSALRSKSESSVGEGVRPGEDAMTGSTCSMCVRGAEIEASRLLQPHLARTHGCPPMQGLGCSGQDVGGQRLHRVSVLCPMYCVGPSVSRRSSCQHDRRCSSRILNPGKGDHPSWPPTICGIGHTASGCKGLPVPVAPCQDELAPPAVRCG